jgi:hypothetical protein
MAVAGFCIPLAATAFDGLTPAQAWIYDRSHLANTEKGQSLAYAYSGTDDDNNTITDAAQLSIVASSDADRRDVEVEFLSGERHLPLPVFKGYRGNPMIIAMLEHVAQSLSTQTGGGALYFRNRIRDALASEDVELVEQVATYNDQEIDSVVMTFYPFTNDQYLGDNTLLKQARFTIRLSNEIPGGLVSVDVSAQEGDKAFKRNLSIQ